MTIRSLVLSGRAPGLLVLALAGAALVAGLEGVRRATAPRLRFEEFALDDRGNPVAVFRLENRGLRPMRVLARFGDLWSRLEIPDPRNTGGWKLATFPDCGNGLHYIPIPPGARVRLTESLHGVGDSPFRVALSLGRSPNWPVAYRLRRIGLDLDGPEVVSEVVEGPGPAVADLLRRAGAREAP